MLRMVNHMVDSYLELRRLMTRQLGVLQQELLALWEQNRHSVIFVTHDIDEALLLSDRILVLSKQPGTVVGETAVQLPRPRSAETTLTEEFLMLKRGISRLLRTQTVDSSYVA